MPTCRLYPALDTPFHSILETEGYIRNLFQEKKGEKAKDIFLLFNEKVFEWARASSPYITSIKKSLILLFKIII